MLHAKALLRGSLSRQPRNISRRMISGKTISRANMPPTITLDEQESRVRDFLVGTAQHYSKTHDGKVPVLRFAGGWVRDKLLGLGSKDIDVAIDCMTGKAFYKYMKEYDDTQIAKDSGVSSLGRLAEIKKDADKSKHMETATTKLFGLELDLVNLRTETYNLDSRNPEVAMGTAEEDALRRDATINAMFFNLNNQSVEDFTGRGIKDLSLKLIRTPLDPEQTFRDDPLRIMRLIRFACRFDFAIDESALFWMKDQSIQATLERKISRERILVELQKTLQGPDPARALAIILDQGLHGPIFTIPGAEPDQMPVIDIGLVRDARKLLVSLLRTSRPNDNIITRLLLNTPQEQYWAWLLCALLPWIGQALPASLVRKGSPKTMAARIAHDALKIDNKTAKALAAADTYSTTEAVELCRAFGSAHIHTSSATSPEKSPASPGKRKRNADYRVETGLAIRRWGEEWHMVVLAAYLLEAASEEHKAKIEGNTVASVTERYESWLRFIDDEDLDRVWDRKAAPPILDGHEITEVVRLGLQAARSDKSNGVSKGISNETDTSTADGRLENEDENVVIMPGPWLARCVTLVFEYQLREKDNGVNKAGARQAVIDAVRCGAIEVATKQTRKP